MAIDLAVDQVSRLLKIGDGQVSEGGALRAVGRLSVISHSKVIVVASGELRLNHLIVRVVDSLILSLLILEGADATDRFAKG